MTKSKIRGRFENTGSDSLSIVKNPIKWVIIKLMIKLDIDF